MLLRLGVQRTRRRVAAEADSQIGEHAPQQSNGDAVFAARSAVQGTR